MDVNNEYEQLKHVYDMYLATLEKRLQNNPDDHQALLHKAILLYDFYQQPGEGEAIFQFLLQKNPADVDAYLWLGEFQKFFHGNAPEAAKCLEKALGIAPNRADLHAVMGGALGSGEDNLRAEYHYRKAFEIEPTYIGPRRWLANLLFTRGAFKQARHELEEALKYIGDGKWPTNNPVEEYYEEMITGRSSDGNTRVLDFIKEIDDAEAAAKLGTKE